MRRPSTRKTLLGKHREQVVKTRRTVKEMAHVTHHKKADEDERPKTTDSTANAPAPAIGPDAEVSDKTQPFDHSKGFDVTRYDLSKGEIAHPAVPNPQEPAIATLPANQSTGLCVHCGKPVGPGQNYVCRAHMKAS